MTQLKKYIHIYIYIYIYSRLIIRFPHPEKKITLRLNTGKSKGIKSGKLHANYWVRLIAFNVLRGGKYGTTH